eukprot:FR739344.1.p3 GENE.FR739344.1~~FR739344.1.p3  ORF type:complete len:126 (-),score=30.92 FR739344.1:752-1129(-)
MDNTKKNKVSPPGGAAQGRQFKAFPKGGKKKVEVPPPGGRPVFIIIWFPWFWNMVRHVMGAASFFFLVFCLSISKIREDEVHNGSRSARVHAACSSSSFITSSIKSCCSSYSNMSFITASMSVCC